MKAKKLLTALLVSAFAVTLTLGITACGDKKEPSDPTEYDVTYSAGVGTGTAVKKGSYAADATFTVAAADEFNFTYTNGGTDYYIAKWNDGAKDVEIGSTYTMPAHDVTLTAQWEPVATTFTVTYKAGVGEGDDEIGGTYAAEAKFAVAAPNEFGYTYSVDSTDYYISGWSDGTTVTPIGSEYTMPDHDVTLTAQWEVDNRAEVYVTYYDYDGKTVVYEEELHEGDASLYTATPDAARFPYTGNYSAFVEWDKSGFTAHYVTEEQSVYGKWQYMQSDDSYFTFTEIDDSAAYTVSLNPDAGEIEGGGALYLPIIHEGKPVEGITAGTNAETAAFGGLNAATVVIPDTYDVIAAYAFANNEHITAVQIGKTGGTRAEGKKLDIADHAFYYMTNLATFNSETEGTVHIPASTTQIGDYAFAFKGSVSKTARNGSPVTAITFAEHSALTSIGEQAFAYTGAKALVVPASLQTIGKQAFYCAKELASFSAEAGSVLTTIGEQAFIGGTAKNLLGALSTITIPGSVTEIGTKAFYENAIKSLTFEAGTAGLSIGESAFTVAIANEAPLAQSLTIPDRTESIGKEAFKFWGTVRTLTFPTVAKFTTIGEGAFYGFKALESLTLPAGIQTIAKNAFNGAAAITGALVIPEGVTTIGESAFNGLSGISSLTIPNTVTEIATQAFYGTHNLATVTFTPGGDKGLAIREKAFGASSYIGSSKTDDKLTSFEFPARTTFIGKGVFHYRQLLKTVTFAKPAEGEPTLDLEFETLAFTGETKLNSSTNLTSSFAARYLPITSLTIPARTTKIGIGAFATLFDLTSLVFEEGIKVTELPASVAYASTGKLETLTIPEGITKIGNNAFGYAQGSKYDMIPEIKYIGVKAKDGGGYEPENVTLNVSNTKLTSLTIPSTVTEIGQFNFVNLMAVQTLRFEDLKEDAAATDAKLVIKHDSFFFDKIDTSIADKVAAVDIYIGSSVKQIDYGFGCRIKLKSLTFSDKSGLQTIDKDVFGVCTDPTITTVELPASLTAIGANTFAGLSSLTSYTVASGNEKYEAESDILYQKAEADGQRTLFRYPAAKADTQLTLRNVIVGDNAFMGNAVIQNVIIEENVTLGNAAFRAAMALKTLTINSQPIYAENASYFFGDCPELTTVTIAAGVTKLGPEMFRMSSVPGSSDNASNPAQTKLTTINGLDHITEYAHHALYRCTKLEFGADFKIPDGVTEIPGHTFAYCEKLTKINLNQVTTIGEKAFGNTEITAIDLTSITSIGNNAFEYTPLVEVTIPDAVTTLSGTFNNCTDLVLIKIPRTADVTTIVSIAVFTNTKFLTAGTAARVVVPDNLVTRYRESWGAADPAGKVTAEFLPEHIVGETQYTITFAKDSDLKGASATIPEEAAKDYKFATYKLPAADEAGIDEGYYLAWIIGEEEYLPGATIYLDGAETSLTATLTAVKYATVTFSWGDGVTDAVGDPPESLKVKHGTIADPNTLPQRPGYAFVGWKKQGAEGLWNFETDVVDGDITLDVVWGKEIDVTFSWGDGVTDVTGELPEETKGNQGFTVADPDVTPTREDYVFKGWKKSDAADTELWNFDEDTIPLDAESIQFVAVWEKKTTVTFSWGDDVSDVEDAVPTEQKVAKGGKVTDPAVTPTREGFTLKGWKKKGDDDSALWNFGTSTVPEEGDTLELVAVWEATLEG